MHAATGSSVASVTRSRVFRPPLPSRLELQVAARTRGVDRPAFRIEPATMPKAPSIPLPRHWPKHVKSGFLHAMALARAVLITVRSGYENSPLERARLIAKAEHLAQENAWLKEELRIKDVRMARIEPSKRPHYPRVERFAILALRAATGWTLAETARRFFLARPTVASWMRRLEENGPEALVQTPEPVNGFSDAVALLLQNLKLVMPSLGRRKIADVLARAGFHLAPSTAERLLKRKQRPQPEAPAPSPAPQTSTRTAEKPARTVQAKFPHHAWNIDLTVVPTGWGLWVPWWPFSLPIFWPFAWHIAIVLDHFSRAVIATAVFDKEAKASDIVALLDRAAVQAGRAPRHIISDRGAQFQSLYRDWCARNGVKPRFGAIGKHGSIALLERMIRTLKDEGLRKIFVPLTLPSMQAELAAYVLWYNEHRPSSALGGATLAERLEDRTPARDRPRLERRARFPLARGDPAVPLIRPRSSAHPRRAARSGLSARLKTVRSSRSHGEAPSRDGARPVAYSGRDANMRSNRSLPPPKTSLLTLKVSLNHYRRFRRARAACSILRTVIATIFASHWMMRAAESPGERDHSLRFVVLKAIEDRTFSSNLSVKGRWTGTPGHPSLL